MERSDVVELSRASHQTWEVMAAGWDERHAYIERVTRPVGELMLERLDPAPGQTVLDLAAGTGIVGFAVAQRVGDDGRVIVSDFASAMVEAAERHARDIGLDNVECRVLDAQRLELPDDAVDGVCCRWGYMLMPDPAAALAETRRVLRPGGRLSFAVFGGPEQNAWAALPAGVLTARGHMPPPGPGTPGILALGDRGRLRDLTLKAGFSEPTIDEVAFTWEFDGFDDYWQLLIDTAGAIAMVLERLDAAERDRVREAIADRLAPPDAGPFRLEAVSLVAAAS